MTEKTFTESFKVAGGQLLDMVKKVIHEGNVRRVVIKQDTRVIAEFPVTVGVVGAMLAPILAAIGAIAAFMNECTIEVERTTSETAQAGSAAGQDQARAS